MLLRHSSKLESEKRTRHFPHFIMLANLHLLLVICIAASGNAETISYDGFTLNNNLGCHQSAWPPMTESEIGTFFKLYTTSRLPPNGVEIASGETAKMIANGFNSNKNTYFVIHGYNSNSENDSYYSLYRALIDTETANVFAVDWRNGANVANYNKARQNIRVVGNQLAIFASNIGQSSSKIYFVGHSLGAHTAGYAGEAYDGTVARITGLDPAGPGFSDQTNSKCRLDPTDADFVDNIHTDDDMYGTTTAMGHVDFYPNGGSSQPGCITDVASCSHSKVKEYYTESVKATSCKFTSYQCSSWSNYDAGQCTSCWGGCCNYMGYWATSSCTGKRWLKTNGSPQYCIS